jgi:hypothetical protein
VVILLAIYVVVAVAITAASLVFADHSRPPVEVGGGAIMLGVTWPLWLAFLLIVVLGSAPLRLLAYAGRRAAARFNINNA